MLKRIRELFGRRGDRPSPHRGSPSESVGRDRVATPADGEAGEDVRSHTRVHRGPAVVHLPIPDSDLDADAVKIIRRLTRFDHTAYLVGGCVRDLLLDRHPKDFDIATSATPRQVKRSFSNCRIIGRRFRLAHVYFQNGKIIEVATFRALDGVDGDGGPAPDEDLLIRDDNVFGTPEEDALRRDFTINALFYDVNAGNVLDHADGLGDLRRKLVRTIGDPEIRFREDPIRILRAIKFAARLGFRIEPTTLEALRRTRHEIPKAAPPRILEEINRFCRGGAAARSFELLRETEVFDVVLPELAGDYDGDDGAAEMLGGFLSAIDRRQAKGHEVTTGAILAALLVPLLREPLRWGSDGTVATPRRGDMRDVVAPLLQPLSQRLRVSRRDQEQCRQIIATLHRMVPARNLRRGMRAALRRRTSFPLSLVMLEVLADRPGGDFSEAARYWTAAADEKVDPKRKPERVSGSLAAAGAGGSKEPEHPVRKRRRSRRRTRKPSPAASEGGGRPRTAVADKPRKPPVWDDDYFFAALPTVPELEPETPRPAPDHEADGGGSQGSEGKTTGGRTGRPRRRRRSRRRSSAGQGNPPEDS